MQARWSAAGTEHTGAVKAQSTVEAGDPIEIWVDNNGAQVPAPTPTTRAAVEAVTGALVIWICVAAMAATLFTLTRAVCRPYPLHRMATRPRQSGRPWRRASVSGPHFGTLTPLMAPPYTDPTHAHNVVMTAASANDSSNPDQPPGHGLHGATDAPHGPDRAAAMGI